MGHRIPVAVADKARHAVKPDPAQDQGAFGIATEPVGVESVANSELSAHVANHASAVAKSSGWVILMLREWPSTATTE